MIVSRCIPYVLQESITLNVLQSRLHGLDHWFRVWKNAEMLTGREKSASLEVVALYALFHDSMRQNEGSDPDHGRRGYKLWERFHRTTGIGEFLSNEQSEMLFDACVEHSNGYTSMEPTIAVCWDADRLDLHRKGIWPDARFMSTQAGEDLTPNKIPNTFPRSTNPLS